MDPLTVGLAAGVAPLILSQFMPKPQMPGAPDYSAALAYLNSPQLQQARTSILNNAFTPNTALYNLAASQAMNNTNRALAQRGLGNSGVGLQMINDQQTNLANQFQQNELQRQLQAYSAVSGSMNPLANLAQSGANAANQNAMLAYQQQMQGQQALMGGINNGLQAGMSAYQFNNMMNRMGYPNVA